MFCSSRSARWNRVQTTFFLQSNELRRVYDSLDKFKFVSVDSDSIEATPSVTNTAAQSDSTNSTELNSRADTSQLLSRD